MALLWTFPERMLRVYPQGKASTPIIVTMDVADARARAYLDGDPDAVESIDKAVVRIARNRHKVSVDERIIIELLPKSRVSV